MTVRKSIVVPCYNEAGNLPNLIARFEALVPADRRRLDWELVLVDNGSTDNSAEVLAAELQDPERGHARDFVRVVTVPRPNVGYGHGIVTGLRAARGDLLAWTHADGQTPPRDVLRAFEMLETSPNPDATLVKGRRRARPLRDTLFTMGMQVAALAILGESLEDINGQPKAFTRKLFELAQEPPTDLSLDLYFFYVAKKHGFTVRTFDVDFGAREHGESKWAFNFRSKARNVARSVKYMAALRRS